MKCIVKIILILPMVISIGCTPYSPEPEYDPEEMILFSSPMLTVESKSNLKNAFEDGDEFGVLGYCLPYTIGTTNINYAGGSALWSNKINQCAPLVFYKQKVIVKKSGCIYDRNGGSGNDPKYWYREGYDIDNRENSSIVGSDDYQYTFFAYYPYDPSEQYFKIDSPTSASSTGGPVFTFTMPQNGASIDDHLEHKDTPDAMLAALYNRQKSDGNLKFVFSHILTGLGFEVNNFSGTDLTIYSITLKGSFLKKLTVDLSSGTLDFTSEERYSGTYTIYDGGMSGLFLPGVLSDETSSSSPSPIGGEHLLLISGDGGDNGYTYLGDDLTVTIGYKFGDDNKSQDLIRPGTFTPKPGVKYTAQLNFVGNAFVLQFVVDNSEEWQDGEAEDGDETNDDIIFE